MKTGPESHPRGGRKRKGEGSQRRAEILDAAKQLFVEEGYAATTIRRIAAKLGVSSTALYVYFPLASLNEVGGDPRVAGNGPAAFHRFVAARQGKWPHSLNATTTHDTKRSEDTRCITLGLSWRSKMIEP